MRLPILYIFTLLLLIGCTDTPEFNDTPELTYDGIQNNFLAQSTARDTVFILFSLTDAQGDIGERFPNDPNPSVFLIDERDDFVASTFLLPKINKQGSGNGVRADVRLLYPIVRGDLCCRYPDGTGGCIPSTDFPVDSIFYSLHVVDHAGNESNRIRVGPVFLTCD